MNNGTEETQVRTRRPTKRLEFDPQATISLGEDSLEGLRKFHKMVNLGHLAAGSMHDFGAYIRAINMHAAFALEALEKKGDDDIRSHLGAIMSACKPMQSIRESLLNFGACTEKEFTRVSLKEAVEECVAFLRPIFPRDIDMEVHTEGGGDIAISGDKHLLGQLLVNLVRNAKQSFQGKAMKSCERKKIKIFVHTLRRREDENLVPGSTTRCVAFSVTDTGVGMSDETFENIAQPFFTTKGANGGLGLGLLQVKFIAHRHGGVVVASTREEEGSTFTVYFPRSGA